MALVSTDPIYKNDFGVKFLVTLQNSSGVIDISNPVTTQFLFRKPVTDNLLTVTAALKTDGTDGKLQYLSNSGDLDECGKWRIQAYVLLDSGTKSFHSEIDNFFVADIL